MSTVYQEWEKRQGPNFLDRSYPSTPLQASGTPLRPKDGRPIIGYNTTNGEDTGTIHNSYNTGAVMGDDYIGGIVGCNYNTVAQCGNTGSVTGSGNYIGGVAGYNNNYTNLFTPTFIGTIENTYNTGAVTGGDYIGGIVGQAEDGACAYKTIIGGRAGHLLLNL